MGDKLSDKMMTTMALARSYLIDYGLIEWSFKFDNAKRRAGCCKYRYKIISLSRYYVDMNDYDEIIDTILHEIAHAIVGPGNGHGPKWVEACLVVGAKPVRCYDSSVVKMPKGRWTATCICPIIYHRHRKPKYKYHCRKCKTNLNYTQS